MKNYKLLGLAIVVGSLLAAGPAAAQDYGQDQNQDQNQVGQDQDQGDQAEDNNSQDQVTAPEDNTPAVAQPEAVSEPYEQPTPVVQNNQPALTTPFGLGLTIGGGVNGFTDGDFNNFVNVGGGWEGRLTIGTRSIVGLEASYVGTANGIDNSVPGVSNNAYLLSNGVDGAIRLNLTTTAVRPFILAGAGWKHYSIQNTNVNTSALQNSDDVVEFPLGAGLNFTYDRFMADVRGVFKPSIDNEMFRSQINNDANKLHTWQANANIGFEF